MSLSVIGAFVVAHQAMFLGGALMISEGLALFFPNASGILKAIMLLKKAGAKEVVSG